MERMPEQKAIRVFLEHRENPSIAIDLPYSIPKPGEPPKTGDIALYLAARNVWSDEPTS